MYYICIPGLVKKKKSQMLSQTLSLAFSFLFYFNTAPLLMVIDPLWRNWFPGDAYTHTVASP